MMNLLTSHKIKTGITASLLVLLLAGTEVLAQNGGFAGASSRVGYNARGMAMSNAMAAVTSQGAFGYYNPAQSALFSETRQADITAGVLSFDRIFQSTGAHFQIPPSAGISLHLMRTGVKNIDGRTQSGYHTGTFDASEYQLASSFGIRMSEKMNAGIGVKFNLANYHEDLDNPVALGIDFGLLYHASEPLNIAFTVKDLFAGYTWNSQELYGLDQARNVINQFPTRLIWGAAYQKEVFTISADFELLVFDSERERSSYFIENGSPSLITTTENVSTSGTQFRLGGAWNAHERLTLRAGWQLPDTQHMESWGMSSGFSIHLPFDVFSPSVDYAFVLEPYQVSNMHIFSLRLNL